MTIELRTWSLGLDGVFETLNSEEEIGGADVHEQEPQKAG